MNCEKYIDIPTIYLSTRQCWDGRPAKPIEILNFLQSNGNAVMVIAVRTARRQDSSSDIALKPRQLCLGFNC